MSQKTIPSFQLEGKFADLPPLAAAEVESYVVNQVKVNLLKMCDSMLDGKGKQNLRELLLVPIFSIPEMTKRVKERAPEMHTLFFHELVRAVDETEKKLT